MIFDEAPRAEPARIEDQVVVRVDVRAARVGGGRQAARVIPVYVHEYGFVVRAEGAYGHVVRARADGAQAPVDVEVQFVRIDVAAARRSGADPGFARALDDDDDLLPRGFHGFDDAAHGDFLRQRGGGALHEHQILVTVAASERVPVGEHEERARGGKRPEPRGQRHIHKYGEHHGVPVVRVGDHHGLKVIRAFDAAFRLCRKADEHVADTVVFIVRVALLKQRGIVRAVREVQRGRVVPPAGGHIRNDAVNGRIDAGHHLEELHHHAPAVAYDEVVLAAPQRGRVGGPHVRAVVRALSLAEAEGLAVVFRALAAAFSEVNDFKLRVLPARGVLHRRNADILVYDAAPELIFGQREGRGILAGNKRHIRAERVVPVGRDDHGAVDVVVHALVYRREKVLEPA